MKLYYWDELPESRIEYFHQLRQKALRLTKPDAAGSSRSEGMNTS
jgi:hypothetical protein